MISAFEEKQDLVDLVKERMSDTENTGIQVYIGDEMPVPDFDKVWADSDRDYWMTAQEAKEYGMIDEVLSRKPATL